MKINPEDQTGVVHPGKLGEVVSPLPKTPTLFMTKICDFCLLYLLPDQKCDTVIYDCCGLHSCPKHNLQRAFVEGLVDNDKKGRFSYPIQD